MEDYENIPASTKREREKQMDQYADWELVLLRDLARETLAKLQEGSDQYNEVARGVALLTGLTMTELDDLGGFSKDAA